MTALTKNRASKTFKGRPILPAQVAGEALVTHRGFNVYASFYTSIHRQVGNAMCSDSGNPDLYGKNLTDKILCLPLTVGSTSAAAVWQHIARRGIAPRAVLFAEQIDALAAGGLIVADVWAKKRICTVDRLGAEFLNAVKDGDRIVIQRDGTVLVESGRVVVG